MRNQWLMVVTLCALLFHGAAHAAGLRFTVSTNEGPQALPLVKVTVSGVEVFNKRTGSFTIPVNTTGMVSIQIVELEQYQRIVGWSGVCAGVTQGNCEFSAGQDVTYDAGIGVKNLFGTLRFTASSADFVRPPDRLRLTVLSGTERVGDTLEPNVIQPCCDTQRLLIGSYSLRPENVSGNDNCFQVGTAATLNATVLEDKEAVVDVKYRADRCAVTANIVGDLTRGSVVSAPAGIDCPNGVIPPGSPSPCSAFFSFKSKVRLQANTVAGSVFAGWSAGCGSKFDLSCEVDAIPGGAKVASFVAATSGSADLSVVPSSFVATDAGGGRVKVSFTVTNAGADPASSVRTQIFSSGIPGFSEIPSVVSDGGDCFGAVNCLWTTGGLPAGMSRTLSFTAATTKTSFNLRACTLGSNADPNPDNNCSSGAPTLSGTPPISSSLSVAVGNAPPMDRIALKGSGINPMLQFTVTPTNGPLTLEGLSLQASGSGDDAQDLTSLVLIADTNGNGALDAGEAIVASGKFIANDGTLTLPPSSLTALNAPTTFLVAASINGSLAQFGGGAILSGALLLAGLIFSRGRKTLLGLGLIVTLSSCPTPAPSLETRTYKVTLTAVTATQSGQTVTASGLPLAGAELTVEK